MKGWMLSVDGSEKSLPHRAGEQTVQITNVSFTPSADCTSSVIVALVVDVPSGGESQRIPIAVFRGPRKRQRDTESAIAQSLNLDLRFALESVKVVAFSRGSSSVQGSLVLSGVTTSINI